MTLENSLHYGLNNSVAGAEFRSLYPESSMGFIRLGPHNRFFGLSMYHQLHCLESLRLALLGVRPHNEFLNEGTKEKVWTVDHVAHCLNYLRQTILCAADLTLEPEVVDGSGDVGQGLGVTHVCRDWSVVNDYAERNAARWLPLVSNATGNS